MKEILQKLKKITRRVLVILLIIGIGLVAFLYFGVYSSGDRVGKVIKISNKGMIFKTYEGQLNMEGFGAIPGQSVISQTFEFSVEQSNIDLVEKLKRAMNEGKRVNIRYIERYWQVPWRGDTRHFIREVTIIEDGT